MHALTWLKISISKVKQMKIEAKKTMQAGATVGRALGESFQNMMKVRQHEQVSDMMAIQLWGIMDYFKSEIQNLEEECQELDDSLGECMHMKGELEEENRKLKADLQKERDGKGDRVPRIPVDDNPHRCIQFYKTKSLNFEEKWLNSSRLLGKADRELMLKDKEITRLKQELEEADKCFFEKIQDFELRLDKLTKRVKENKNA
jgi:chromosome segregation ATPase